jgi:hypothetical protein
MLAVNTGTCNVLFAEAVTVFFSRTATGLIVPVPVHLENKVYNKIPKYGFNRV